MRPTRFRRGLFTGLATAGALGVASLACSGASPMSGAGAPTRAAWKEIDAWSASRSCRGRRPGRAAGRSARAAGDDGEWARALVRRRQLRIALGGYETAVEALARRALARGSARRRRGRALLRPRAARVPRRLLLGDRPARAGGRRREARPEGVDRRADRRRGRPRASPRVWARREELGAVSRSPTSSTSTPNDYPEGIRPTLRDAVSYLFVERLADSSRWSPAEANEIWQLDLAALLPAPASRRAARFRRRASTRCSTLAAVLADLERWHRAAAASAGAELEAYLERLARSSRGALEAEEDRAARPRGARAAPAALPLATPGGRWACDASPSSARERGAGRAIAARARSRSRASAPTPATPGAALPPSSRGDRGARLRPRRR